MRSWAYGLSIVAVAALVSVALASENIAPAQGAPAAQTAQCGAAQRHDRSGESGTQSQQSVDCPGSAASVN